MEDKGSLEIINVYANEVDLEMRSLISAYPNFEMYQMISYFLGFLDENLESSKSYGGKRFRAGICMMLADFYGKPEDALIPATAIELFHNFTLIHDDIADRDEYRRGRETVWKKWGINQALNTGDVLMMLVYSEMNKLATKKPEVAQKINSYMNERFIEVVEGQHLDFTFSELSLDDARLTEDAILDMLGRKSGVLVGLPAVAAGILAEVSDKEIERLWQYGYNLGVTYQLCDDIISIWGEKADSGKDDLADIREKKKTWPILHLFNNADAKTKQLLLDLYSKKADLTQGEINSVKALLDQSCAREYVLTKAHESLAQTTQMINDLQLDKGQKEKLHQANAALFPILYEASK